MKAIRWSVLFVCAALLCACSEESSVSSDNNPPCNGECGAQEHCIEATVANAQAGLEVGDMFCSACLKDCAADKEHPVCIKQFGVCGATDTCGNDESLTLEGGYVVCKKGSGAGNNDHDKSCAQDCSADKEHPVCVKQFGVCGATDTCGEGESLAVEGGYAVCKKDSGGNNPGSKDEDYSLDISDSAVTVQCEEVKEVTVTYLKGEEKIEDASLKLVSSDADCVNVADDVSTNKDGIGTIELKAKELGKDCTAEITVSAEGVDAQKINVTVEGKDCDSDDEMCHNNDDCADGEYCIEALYEVGNGDTDSVKVGEMFCSACPTDCDPTSQYPVCASSVHACAATASCPGGQVFQVKGNVAVCISGTVKTCNNDEDCESGYVCDANKVCAPDAKTCEKDTDCETGYVCKAKQCVADAKTCEKDTDCESGYVCKAKQCVADANACENDADCETGYVCKDKQCVVEVYNKFKYVRIDDMSVACTLDKDGLCHVDDPGADIDAVVLAKVDNTLHYAVSVTGYQRSDGLKAGERYDQNKPAATDPTRALGQPDAFAAYPAVDGKCAYYIDAEKTVHPYVSLGGMGGYVVLEMANAIEAGDKIDVLEIGACDLQNTKDGGSQKAKAEEIQISISSTGETWKIVGKHSADSTNQGILSFTISSNMLN